MLLRQIPYSRSFTLFRMKRRWVDPLLVAAFWVASGHIYATGGSICIYATGGPRPAPGHIYATLDPHYIFFPCQEPHGYCLYRRVCEKCGPTYPTCSPRWPYGRRPPRASPHPVIPAKAGIHFLSAV